MTKAKLVSDGAERRVRSTFREITFAIALTAAAALSVYAASIQAPDEETAANDAVFTPVQSR